ncbi:MAG: sulfotransferase domain-containing protein [Saprospiraceae bacterium]|nr:sulfotransferase domain-containing protein [Saprospiraceae bacterium]
MSKNPDFLILGAQKAGTTSLHAYLNQHPDIIFHQVKEFHFFDIQYYRGFEWYSSLFPVDATKITGEATPYYLFHPCVPERVKKHLPHVKMIVLLRNPVDRAYSHFRHGLKYSHETVKSFEEAIGMEAQRLQGAEDQLLDGSLQKHASHLQHSYLTRGFYSVQIQRWFAHFPRSQFLFIQSEKLFVAPQEQLERVYRFLDIPSFSMPEYPIFNEGQYGAPLAPSLRAELMELFRDDIVQTETFTGLTFDWRT